MTIEQFVGELDILEGQLLQIAIDNTDGTYRGIKQYLFDVIDMAEDNYLLISLSENAMDTLDWSIRDVKPFE